ncbi:MAG: UDP-N-acetylmuramoyl-tripeptide--D-alanyl-D-alanine ligase [Clostridia bacterium]|nr:UDP-N-acetylmuramoyl-tripeptide--D-alanyl-D-alanine ligase [Clostridia bacterium]
MLPLNLEKIKELFEIEQLLSFVLIGLITAVIMSIISYKFFQIIQQCGYKGDEYLKWLVNKDNVSITRLSMLCLLSVLGFLLTNMALSFIEHPIISYTGFIVVFIFLFVYIQGERKVKSKIPLVITRRMIRLFITFAVLNVLLSLLLIIGINLIAIPLKNHLLSNFRYAILCITPLFSPYLVLLAYYINEPFERANNKKHIKKAKQKFEEFPNLIKIGITGSYAKTSVKEILNTILSQKYNVLSTPNSFNTPLGIAKTVKRLNSSHEVFIAEMGARHIGDIKELTNLVKPNIAVVTGVTYQHLETFKIFENIAKTKYEIIENMDGGKAVFSADNKTAIEMFKTCKLEKTLAGVEKNILATVYAGGIQCFENGSKFILHLGDKKFEASTCLLGKHNVSNICLAVAVALYLGLTESEILLGISKIKPVKHRLEVLKSDNGVTIIDDSYNANVEGVKCALDTLKLFEGKKYIVTPGLVELGLLEGEENYKLGVEISKVVDVAVLIGRARALRIREGLISKGFKEDQIIMAKDLEDAKVQLNKILKSGDVVLFENDLPDKFV